MTPMERVTCECGKRCSLEEAIIDEDGNWNCAQCQAEAATQVDLCEICVKPLSQCVCD